MKILMVTNTFTPHVGGVARSIEAFVAEYKKHGHQVLVVAPTFDKMPKYEDGVVRVPAIQNFNNTDFSVALIVPGILLSAMEKFEPNVIHSHHPFVLGSSALRIAHTYQLPLVFTHHTKYEDYTHYLPGDSDILKRFVIHLATNYANLCDQVFAPSESIAALLQKRGVTTPVSVVPTGVDLHRFAENNGAKFRKRIGIPTDCFVVGHVGRLSKEKNISYLTDSVVYFLKEKNSIQSCCFLLVGEGPMKQSIIEKFQQNGLESILYETDFLESGDLVSAYHAMDVLVFSSKSETQGMVITEAMAAGVPVVALDAPGVKDIVVDRCNGRLLDDATQHEFSFAIKWIQQLGKGDKEKLQDEIKITVEKFSMDRSAKRALKIYKKLHTESTLHRETAYESWTIPMRTVESEWIRLKGLVETAGDTLVKIEK